MCIRDSPKKSRIADGFVETAHIPAVALCIYAPSLISDSCTIRARQ